jgi:hypothetical protein
MAYSEDGPASVRALSVHSVNEGDIVSSSMGSVENVDDLRVKIESFLRASRAQNLE